MVKSILGTFMQHMRSHPHVRGSDPSVREVFCSSRNWQNPDLALIIIIYYANKFSIYYEDSVEISMNSSCHSQPYNSITFPF